MPERAKSYHSKIKPGLKKKIDEKKAANNKARNKAKKNEKAEIATTNA